MKPTLLLFLLAIGASGQQTKPTEWPEIVSTSIRLSPSEQEFAKLRAELAEARAQISVMQWEISVDNEVIASLWRRVGLQKPAGPPVRKHHRKRVKTTSCLESGWVGHKPSCATTYAWGTNDSNLVAPKPQEVKKP